MDVIDLHCHLLPGIDDGPASIEESLALARSAAAAGTRKIVATPHVSWRYPNDAATIGRLARQLQERLREERIDLDVAPGAEVAMTRVQELTQEELAQLTLGGGEWLLIEPPFAAVAPAFGAIVLELMQRGHRVVVAHPERCQALRRDPEMLSELVRAGALSSITAGSLTGRFGAQVRKFALQLLDADLVHNVASDAHDTVNRTPALASDMRRAGLGDLLPWLTSEVPSAILEGTQIPPRPPSRAQARGRAPRARLLGRLLRGN
jgi:protein-tyrosine phosphatase